MLYISMYNLGVQSTKGGSTMNYLIATDSFKGSLSSMEAKFAILSTGEAVIEMAQASGLLRIDPKERNILSASTYGTGQLIKKALDMGCRKICIGIGGSATNDGGVG